MSRAGIIARPRKGDGRVGTESTLVFRGPHRSDLRIFDWDGREIGVARRSRDGYELSDAGPICTVREVSKSFLSGRYFAFSVRGSGGTEVGTVAREKRQKPQFEPSVRELLMGAPPSTMGFKDAPAFPIPSTRTPDALLKDRDENRIATLWARPRREVIRNRRPAPDLITRAHSVLDR
jgi:hypothetical protein